eukprot:371700_1
MSTVQQEALIEHIKSADCIDNINIMPLLHLIPFCEIQTFVEQHIRKLNANAIREAYFNSLSIDDILPSDLVGHVLSFQPFPYNASINQTNKMWNKLSSQLKHIQNKERIKAVDEYDLHYNEEVNNTWIIDANRTQLTNDERDSGFKGPLPDIGTALDMSESGDKLLIYGRWSYKT